VSHFGIGDLEALMHDTHKFESRYLETLLAPLDNGGREMCKQRSPIHHIHKLNTATGFFQGDEDKVSNYTIVSDNTIINKKIFFYK
jgi:hypothetical protein